MRVVSGTLKGRRFTPPSNFKARPTTDTAREALFNILAHSLDFEGMAVLDLFAGTGAISYEFASRGCSNITLVEMQMQNFSFIQKCTREFGLTNIIKLVKGDAFNFIEKSAKYSYDLIFADPPFDLREFDRVVPAILNSNILKPDGVFIIEHGTNYDYSSSPCFVQTRKYGKVCFTFFKTVESQGS